jgi:hypothetical protein
MTNLVLLPRKAHASAFRNLVLGSAFWSEWSLIFRINILIFVSSPFDGLSFWDVLRPFCYLRNYHLQTEQALSSHDKPFFRIDFFNSTVESSFIIIIIIILKKKRLYFFDFLTLTSSTAQFKADLAPMLLISCFVISAFFNCQELGLCAAILTSTAVI